MRYIEDPWKQSNLFNRHGSGNDPTPDPFDSFAYIHPSFTEVEWSTEPTPLQKAAMGLSTTIQEKAAANPYATNGTHQFSVLRHNTIPGLTIVFDWQNPESRITDYMDRTLTSSVHFAMDTDVGKDVVSYHLYDTPKGIKVEREATSYIGQFDDSYLGYTSEQSGAYRPEGQVIQGLGPVTFGEMSAAAYYALGAEAVDSTGSDGYGGAPAAIASNGAEAGMAGSEAG